MGERKEAGFRHPVFACTLNILLVAPLNRREWLWAKLVSHASHDSTSNISPNGFVRLSADGFKISYKNYDKVRRGMVEDHIPEGELSEFSQPCPSSAGLC
jgi:hypothetical protein